MSKNMLGGLPLSEVQGPRDDFEQKLAGNDGEIWLREFRRFLRKEPCWTEGRGTQVAELEPTPSILELVSTIITPATTSKFIAKEKFVINTECNAPVKISFLGNNFTEWFLSGDGKTEGLIGEQTLRYHKLRQSSVDDPIIAELGGAEKSGTTLSEMFSLMEKQGKGEAGVLLNNGYANIFYIKDSTGVLRTVYVGWSGDGWFVRAYSVERPFRWDGGRQVFSRLPAEASAQAGNSVLCNSVPQNSTSEPSA